MEPLVDFDNSIFDNSEFSVCNIKGGGIDWFQHQNNFSFKGLGSSLCDFESSHVHIFATVRR